MTEPWWKSCVCYEIYPRSFADGNGAGEGDLEGIRRRLDYLQWLGIDAIWICPFYPSPMADNGYDITDFCDIDPRYGTLADFDRLLADAHARGIRVVVDWVPNHTSVHHPWFVQARSTRGNPKRDWYYWRDEPNNWRAAISKGSAWQLDPSTEQYYLHYFLPAQPDLNWYNDQVVEAMFATLRFWLDRGVDGFRIDSATCLGKDLSFANDDRCFAGEPIAAVTDQPRTHEVLRQARTIIDGYPGEQVLVGEVDIRTEAAVISYYGSGSELHLSFNFPPIDAPWDPIVWREILRVVEDRLGRANA
jgi:alpha-glucosidase